MTVAIQGKNMSSTSAISSTSTGQTVDISVSSSMFWVQKYLLWRSAAQITGWTAAWVVSFRRRFYLQSITSTYPGLFMGVSPSSLAKVIAVADHLGKISTWPTFYSVFQNWTAFHLRASPTSSGNPASAKWPGGMGNLPGKACQIIWLNPSNSVPSLPMASARYS